jgi:hypothetical protein
VEPDWPRRIQLNLELCGVLHPDEPSPAGLSSAPAPFPEEQEDDERAVDDDVMKLATPTIVFAHYYYLQLA